VPVARPATPHVGAHAGQPERAVDRAIAGLAARGDASSEASADMKVSAGDWTIRHTIVSRSGVTEAAQ